MRTPPIAIIGASTSMAKPMANSCWICWTSLVVRVSRDGAPKRFTSWLENLATWS